MACGDQNIPKPCPSCGHCPTCGHRPDVTPYFVPVYPQPAVVPTWRWWPTIWCEDGAASNEFSVSPTTEISTTTFTLGGANAGTEGFESS